MPVEVKGARELALYIHSLSERLDPAMRSATILAGGALRDHMRRNADTGQHQKGHRRTGGGPGPNRVTGHLHDSILYTQPFGSRGAYSTTVGPSARYGRWVEEGHAIRRAGRTVGQCPAYPYVRPAGAQFLAKDLPEISRQVLTQIAGG